MRAGRPVGDEQSVVVPSPLPSGAEYPLASGPSSRRAAPSPLPSGSVAGDTCRDAGQDHKRRRQHSGPGDGSVL